MSRICCVVLAGHCCPFVRNQVKLVCVALVGCPPRGMICMMWCLVCVRCVQNVVVPLSKVLPQRRNSKTTLAIPALSSTSSSDEDDSHPGNGSETAKATTTNKRRSASTKSLQSSQANHGGSMDNNGAPAHEPALPSRTSQVSKEGSTDADGLITLNSNVVHAGEAISMPVKASAKRTRAASARIKTAASARAAADAEANTHGPDVIGAQGGKKSVRGRSKGGDIASVGASVGEPAAKSGWSV